MSGYLPQQLAVMRELERPTRRRPQTQEFDPVAATLAESRRSTSRQPLPLPPTPPAVVPPPPAGEPQAEAGTPTVFPGETAQDARPFQPASFNRDNPYVAEAVRLAQKYNLPENVFLSLIKRESNFNPTASNESGAYGLAQLMPRTARELGVDPRNPYQNLEGGARYLRQMLNQFKSLPIALAAYNAGPGKVSRAGNVIPDIKETREYVEAVMRNAGITHFSEGGLASLDQKYADGGPARRPAAAPTMTPFDPDYIDQLAARVVGGPGVDELRSAEGRDFAPMPRDPKETLQRLRAVLRGEVEPTPGEQSAINIVRGFTEGPASIRAYHGSPYRFDQFDPTHIGKGLGQQAYARGLYFAEAEPAAKHFRDAASEKMMSPGYMYEVDLHAKPRDFLQYDQVWSKQSPEVRESLERFNIKPDMSKIRDYEDALKEAMESKKYENLIRLSPEPFNPLGSEIYNKLLNMNPEEASRALMNAGIPGTRYVDPGFRAVGQYHNYSVFDPEIIELVRRYAEGGEVKAPAETTIGGQDHWLAYITDEEAALLKAHGGSGRMTEHGIRAYDDGGDGGDGGDGNSGGDANDNSTSNSEASSQDAVGGNAGQGAGPTGAGAGSTGETGPGNSEGLGETGADTEDADQGKAMAATPIGTYAGFSPISFSQALEAYDQGRMSLGQLAANMAISSVPGVTPGVNRDAIGEITEAISVSPVGLGLGLAGLATGVPGLGTLGSMAGTALGQALGVGNVVGTPSTTNLGPDATGNTDQYGAYGYGAYGTPDVDISNSGGFARGGLADLSAKYAGGGEVSVYDPYAVNRLAQQIEAEYV